MNPQDQLDKLLAEAKVAYQAAKAITSKDGEMSEEDDQKFQAFMGEYDRCVAKADPLRRLLQAEKELDEPRPLQAAHLGFRPSSPKEGLEEIDVQSYHEVEVQTAQMHPLFGLMPVTKKVRYYTPVKLLDLKGYEPAFESYIRFGAQRVATMYPNDFKTLTEGIDSAGGFLTPAQYQAELIKKIAAIAVVRANARVLTTSRDMVTWPKVTYTTDDKYTSGVRMSWVGESPAASTSHRVTNPVFGLYTIPINTGMASLPLSRDLIEDSAFDVIGVSQDMMAEAFTLGEEDKFWNGTGAGEPMGIISRVAATTSPGADEIEYIPAATAQVIGEADIFSLWGALPSQYELNAKWYFSKATEMAIRQLADTNGQYFWPIMPQVGGFGVHPRELIGFPSVRTEFVEAYGSDLHPIIYGDLNAYVVIDRVGFSLERLTEIYAETNIHLLLARKRVGGEVVQPWRVKALKTLAST